MKTKPDSHTRTRTCTRRLSACTRHPDEPITGICASCLRERLSGIDSSAVNGASSSALSTDELRRCRSVSATKCEASCVYNEPRRKSCDDRARNSLAELLFVETSVPIGSVKVDKDKLGFGDGDDDDDDEVGEGEVKTMKEHIDLVIQSGNPKKSKDLSSFWEAASVLSKKLQIWKPLKSKSKKLGQGNVGNGVDDCKLKAKKLGQREPSRLSVDAGRISVDRSRRLSLDEPRASWDGYLIAKTIPRLAPMLSVVENEMLWGGNKFDCNRLSVDGQMQSIIEDESSSGGLDSSSSQRWSSFDRSVSLASSGKKTTTGVESDEGNLMSPTKLVITESELKDWRLKSSVNKDDNCDNFEPIGKAATSGEACGNVNNGSKKSTRWGKMFNVLNKTPKSSEKNCENLKGIAVASLVADGRERREEGGGAKETLGSKRTGINSVANPRKSFDMFGFNQTMRNGKQVKEVSDHLVSARNSFDVSRFNQSMRNGGETKDGRKLSRLASSRRSLDMIGLDHDARNFTKDNVFAKKGEEFFELELNKSAKNSSCKIDDSALPFYLTPLRTSKSSKSGRHRPQNSISLNGNILESN